MDAVVQHWTEAEQNIIRNSVGMMLASPLFAGSPRQQRFLNYLVTNTLAGDADRLKGYTIAVEVFDKESSFDPSLDAIVRVEAARLRNKLREYYDTLDKQDAVRIDFPKGCYAVKISLQHQSAAEVTASSTPVNIPRLIEDKPSLAVMPFANIGADNAKEYFADGVVDSLISMLSRLSGLFIVSRQSSFSYKNTSKTSKEIATELGVRYLLEGSVQHADNQVRVAAQLVDAIHGGQVWSERYDRELKDIFALQDELTQNIVSVLQIRLAGAEAEIFGYKGSHNIEAHDTLLQGMAQHWLYTEKTTNEAIALFTKALSLDPNSAVAHAWLARSMALTWSQRWNLAPAILDVALLHARQAAELDPQSPYAMSILGWVQIWRKNRDESIAECRRAVALDPNNAEAHVFLSLALTAAGLGEEALYYAEKAKRFTPTPFAFYDFALGCAYYVLKDYPKAIAVYGQGYITSPTFIPCYLFQMFSYEHLGMHEKVHKLFKIIYVLKGDAKGMPTMGIWTDKALAAEEERLWQTISSRYS